MSQATETEKETEQREAVKTWLLTNYLRDTPETRAEVECILSQDDWKHVGAQAEKFRGMAVDDAQATVADGFALSALYECHDGPHLPTCPCAK